MVSKLEEQMEILKKKLENLEAGKNTVVNVHGNEQAGASSCVVKKTAKGEKNYEVKVYSNDLLGANNAVNEALNQSKRLDAEVNNND